MGDVVSNYTGPDAPDGNAIEAGGSSLTKIAGSVKGDITIKDSAMVVVHDGSSDNNTPQAESSGTQYFFPVDKGAAPSAEFTDEQLRLLELCKSYGPTSMLDKTVYSIFNFSSDMQEIFDARVSISDMIILEGATSVELLYNVKAALEQAIKNVKYGDVSPESIEMVQVMFTVYKETAQSIGDAV